MKTISIINNNHMLSNKLIANYCVSFICRLKGLMFRKKLGFEEGLLLVNRAESQIDASIHMLFVFTDLGVIWMNSNLEVVDIIHARSWHLFYYPQKPAQYILEIHTLRLKEFQIGDKLELQNA